MKRDQTQRVIGYAMVAIAAILLGISGNISILLFNNGISPLTLNGFRMLIGAACLLFILLVWRRHLIKWPKGTWGWIIVFGLSFTLHTYSYFLAISRLPLAVTLVIIFSATVWMALGETMWQKRLPSRTLILSAILAFGGVILLVGILQGGVNSLDGPGLLAALVALLSYIAYMLSGQHVGYTLPALTSTCYGALIASLFWFVPLWLVPAPTWQIQHILLIVLVGIIGMALPFTLVLAALRRIDATRVSIVNKLELVTASVLAYFWFGQHLTIWQIAGCVLVLISVIALQFEQQINAGD